MKYIALCAVFIALMLWMLVLPHSAIAESTTAATVKMINMTTMKKTSRVEIKVPGWCGTREVKILFFIPTQQPVYIGPEDNNQRCQKLLDVMTVEEKVYAGKEFKYRIGCGEDYHHGRCKFN
ncbi:hypothetical protein [Desulfovibrio sp. JC010]|uniref:hypothetical protein n=1 Tax=Desulfovibrio sp. JC010 TaxID=2593641 RepID=UPI0013D4B1BF|nr:hypothetical protein [Desulfovibrio sp. JC010]NDV25058.1 hypothetical protein [Desulfovibrio sp. JC010]